jgi:hypothetical protein
MFCPLPSTFTWKLVKTPNCEIIRGEVSIFLGGAGGLSYVSSGSFRGASYVGASCPEAVASEAREARQIKRLVAEAVDNLMRWSVVEAVES